MKKFLSNTCVHPGHRKWGRIEQKGEKRKKKRKKKITFTLKCFERFSSLTRFLSFVCCLKSGIFRLSTRLKCHSQVPGIWSYLRRFLWSTILPYKLTCAEQPITNLYIILRTVSGVGQIERIERQYDFVISIHTDRPDALYRVIIRQGVVVAGQGSTLWF